MLYFCNSFSLNLQLTFFQFLITSFQPVIQKEMVMCYGLQSGEFKFFLNEKLLQRIDLITIICSKIISKDYINIYLGSTG